MIKDALAKLDGEDKFECVSREELREILVALGEVNLVVFPDTYRDELRKINKSFKDIERRVGELEKRVIPLNEKFECMKCGKILRDCKCFKEGVYDAGSGHTGACKDGYQCSIAKIFKPSPEANEEKPCEHSADKVNSCAFCKKPDTIQIPRSIAEEVIRTRIALPNELYDAIKQALKEQK